MCCVAEAAGTELTSYVATTHPLSSVQADWGQVSVLQAQQLLLQEALADPANQVFQLMDAFTVPLYPPLAVYAQLMGSKSRIDVCSDKVRWQEAPDSSGAESAKVRATQAAVTAN